MNFTNSGLMQMNNTPPTLIAPATRFPVPFTLDEFRHDIVWFCFAHVQATIAIANAEVGARLIGLSLADAAEACRSVIERPANIQMSYKTIADWALVRSLVSMYRFGFLGQRDASIEELGPGGYHIAVAALVRDMARSSFQRFWQHIGADGAQQSIARCLHTVEQANARLTLEGLPRFFNFDAKDDNLDLDALINGGVPDYPQGGYGAALTIRQMALLSGLEEQSIRTFANPTRPNFVPTEQRKGRVVVRSECAKAWLIARNRYVPLSELVDDTAIEIGRRPFASLHELEEIVIARLSRFHVGSPIDLLRDLIARHRDTRVDEVHARRAWMTEPACVRDVANLIGVREELFSLRVSEALFSDALQRVKQEIDLLPSEAA